MPAYFDDRNGAALLLYCSWSLVMRSVKPIEAGRAGSPVEPRFGPSSERQGAVHGEKSISGSATPLVSVIIPHYDDLDNLRSCLDLLAAQSAPSERFEIVVADNLSRCGVDAVHKVCGSRARMILAPI